MIRFVMLLTHLQYEHESIKASTEESRTVSVILHFNIIIAFSREI